MKKSHRIGGSEIIISNHEVAGGEVFVLEVASKSSLDYTSVVLNLTKKEFSEIVDFFVGIVQDKDK